MGPLPCLVPSYSPADNILVWDQIYQCRISTMWPWSVQAAPMPSSFPIPMQLHLCWACTHSVSAQPQHFTLEKEEERQKWEEYHPSTYSICWICSSPVRSDQRYLPVCQVFCHCPRTLPMRGSQCFDLQSIADRSSRNSVWSSPGINTLCQAKQTWILCNYYPILQPSPGNKSTKIYT